MNAKSHIPALTAREAMLALTADLDINGRICVCVVIPRTCTLAQLRDLAYWAKGWDLSCIELFWHGRSDDAVPVAFSVKADHFPRFVDVLIELNGSIEMSRTVPGVIE